MADIEKLTIDDTTYDIADAEARDDLETRAKVYYGTCSTSASTQDKAVTTSDDFELKAGVVLIVYFSTGNSARPIRLNVNGTGASSVDQGGELGDYVPNCTFDADSVCEFVYSSSTGWMWVARSASRSALCDTTLNTSNELNLVGNGVRYSGNDSTTATLSYNTAITMKGDTLTAGALKTTSGADLDTVNSGLTNGSVTKVGTSTVGGTAKPIYLSSGTPTALTGTAGGTAQPVYLSSGTITACSSTVGSSTKPVYMSSGTITALSDTIGGTAKPVYMSSGTITACSSTVGSGTVPVYMSSGTITASTSTVGSSTKPVYLSSGTVTASSSTVGSGVIPMYLSSGTLTASSSTVGSGTKPIYLSSGTITVSSSTVGSGTKPVYLSSGTVTASSSTVGSSTKPMYLSSGTLTASSSTVGSERIPIYLDNGVITACPQTYFFSPEAGSISISFYGAGYVTSSSTSVQFVVPLNRPMRDISTVTVTSKGAITLRQDGSYTHGSSSSAGTTSYSASISILSYTGLRFQLTMNSTTNAINNAPVGVALASTTIQFS